MFLSPGFAQDLPKMPWPEFRGPAGDGVAHGTTDLPVEFGEEKNLVWKIPVPGTGYSSPVIDQNHVWLTTSQPQGERSESQGAGGTEFKYQAVDLLLLGFDRESGEQTHSIFLFTAQQPEAIHSLNSYASPTACLDGKHIYCHFGTYGTAAVDATTGEVLWRNDTIQLQHQTGPGSSPILYKDFVIFHADGMDTQSIVALRKSVGEIAWRSQRSGEMPAQPDFKKAFCTPSIANIDGKDLLISPAVDWLYLYDPADGNEVYKIPYGQLGFSTVPRPVIKDNMAYVCTGFMKSRLLAIDLANGSFAEPADRIRWVFEKQVPKMPSPLIMGEWLLLVADTGIASCVDLQSGEEIWTERLGGKFSASPILADGKVYIGSQEGKVWVLEPGRSYKQLSVNSLDSEVMASPAAVENHLYIRTSKSLYKFAMQK